MKKRLASLALALTLLSMPALAVQTGSMDNFVRSRSYTGQFSDLASDSVFYQNVAALYEYGLSEGKADGTYGLSDSLTVGQIVIFAGRIRSLYRTGDPEAGPRAYGAAGASAAEPYLQYLKSEGVVGEELDGALTSVATRAQVAHVLAKVLPQEALPDIHTDLVTQAYASRKYISDVTEYTPYYADILSLYRKGICVGVDAAGSFLPQASITRGAAAAMLTRMVVPALRLTPQWSLEDAHDVSGITLADLVTPGAYIAAPTTEAEMDQAVRYMLSQGSHTLSLHYSDSITSTQARWVMTMALSALRSYCEQSYNSVSCSYTISGDVTLTFTAAAAGSRTEEYRAVTLERAIAVHDALWSSGALHSGMTQTQIARVYYDWICENCTYDFSATDDSLSHIPYQLFTSGTAVCDGYTGAYNLLLKLEGISCSGLGNGSHIWTVAQLDGKTVHIDTTWGDVGTTSDQHYFAMTPEQSYQYHPW